MSTPKYFLTYLSSACETRILIDNLIIFRDLLLDDIDSDSKTNLLKIINPIIETLHTAFRKAKYSRNLQADKIDQILHEALASLQNLIKNSDFNGLVLNTVLMLSPGWGKHYDKTDVKTCLEEFQKLLSECRKHPQNKAALIVLNYYTGLCLSLIVSTNSGNSTYDVDVRQQWVHFNLAAKSQHYFAYLAMSCCPVDIKNRLKCIDFDLEHAARLGLKHHLVSGLEWLFESSKGTVVNKRIIQFLFKQIVATESGSHYGFVPQSLVPSALLSKQEDQAIDDNSLAAAISLSSQTCPIKISLNELDEVNYILTMINSFAQGRGVPQDRDLAHFLASFIQEPIINGHWEQSQHPLPPSFPKQSYTPPKTILDKQDLLRTILYTMQEYMRNYKGSALVQAISLTDWPEKHPNTFFEIDIKTAIRLFGCFHLFFVGSTPNSALAAIQILALNFIDGDFLSWPYVWYALRKFVLRSSETKDIDAEVLRKLNIVNQILFHSLAEHASKNGNSNTATTGSTSTSSTSQQTQTVTTEQPKETKELKDFQDLASAKQGLTKLILKGLEFWKTELKKQIDQKQEKERFMLMRCYLLSIEINVVSGFVIPTQQIAEAEKLLKELESNKQATSDEQKLLKILQEEFNVLKERIRFYKFKAVHLASASHGTATNSQPDSLQLTSTTTSSSSETKASVETETPEVLVYSLNDLIELRALAEDLGYLGLNLSKRLPPELVLPYPTTFPYPNKISVKQGASSDSKDRKDVKDESKETKDKKDGLDQPTLQTQILQLNQAVQQNTAAIKQLQSDMHKMQQLFVGQFEQFKTLLETMRRNAQPAQQPSTPSSTALTPMQQLQQQQANQQEQLDQQPTQQAQQQQLEQQTRSASQSAATT